MSSTDKKGRARKKIKVAPEGRVYIQATFNNIIITFTDASGNVISWSSAGKVGFRGSKKNTPYAGQIAAQDAAKVAYEAGLRTVDASLKGTGSGREAALLAIEASGIHVRTIRDITPIPHNGCRPPKPRRV
ncbi:MAG: 30S ribosomal protein S11 [Bacteroidia bacterium]|nr:30S ribosomal protein S11 [Bacteroidia bacterium]MCX7652690.1 30S ribosomal protein S11 [Bacteroidia bacterium]MDW8416426.1 30S ribosomal protein S11 [Bacteroidia bacterium]